MLCVEDYLDALQWSDSVGGLQGLIQRSEANLGVLDRFVSKNSDWIQFLAADPAIRSNTSVCLTLDLNKDQVCVCFAQGFFFAYLAFRALRVSGPLILRGQQLCELFMYNSLCFVLSGQEVRGIVGDRGRSL